MLAEFARTLRRRWLSVVLVTVIALAGGAGAFIAVGPVQQSTAQVLFVPPRIQPGVNGETNPFLSLGGSLAIVASVVQVGVSDQDTQEDLVRRGDRAKYTVEPNLQENAGPVLLLTATDKSATISTNTLRAVIDAITTELRTIQSQRSVPSNQYITAVTITRTPKPLPIRKAQIQKGVMAFVGLLVVLLGGVLFRERRRQRRAAASATAGGRRVGGGSGSGGNGSGGSGGVGDQAGAETPERSLLRGRRRGPASAPARHHIAPPDSDRVGVGS